MESVRIFLEIEGKCIARVMVASRVGTWFESTVYKVVGYTFSKRSGNVYLVKTGEAWLRNAWQTILQRSSSVSKGTMRHAVQQRMEKLCLSVRWKDVPLRENDDGKRKRDISLVTSWPVKTCLTVDADYFGVLPNGIRGGHTFFRMSHISILANVINTRGSTGCIFFLAWAGQQLPRGRNRHGRV